MPHASRIQPSLTVLSDEQIHHIHEASLHILQTVGMRVESPAVKGVFSKAGCRLTDDERVLIPRQLVEQALASAPAGVDIYDRQGEFVFHVGEGSPARFGIGVTTLYYQDPVNDEVTRFARQHMESMVRLGNALPAYDFISTVGVVQDVDVEFSDLVGTLEMIANTSKPLAVLVSEDRRFADVLDLAEHLHGDLATRPFLIPYFNPISPLVMNKGTTDKMMETIARGLPFIYVNYGMAGATTPITNAGALVLLNAELLAGLTLSQLLKPGTPIILGSMSAFMDMQSMENFYDATSYVANLASAEMMHHYGLPHCGTSGSGMGWTGDVLAAGHHWMNHLTACMGKAGLVPFVGDIFGSKVFSPLLVVLANEIITQARRLSHGFVLDDEHLALAEIAEVGPDGHYLASSLTLQHFRQAYYTSSFWPNLSMESWREQGQPSAMAALRNHARTVLSELPTPPDHDELIARGEAFIARLSG